MELHPSENPVDPIPLEEDYAFSGPNEHGAYAATFYAFNTVITLSGYGSEHTCRTAFEEARDACRVYERLFSRTLPHSDIARINGADGSEVPIDPRTYDLLTQALHYCAHSEGAFDITIGPLVSLWDFKRGIMPSAHDLAQAACHVNWRSLKLWQEEGERPLFFAQLTDPRATLDAGGIAKGWIADALVSLMSTSGMRGFIVNLGGNVAVSGTKPTGEPWRVGIRDPRNPHDPSALLGAVPLRRGSAVTSGTYERGFTREGVRYHHILSPKTGMPAQTDIAGVTVIAEKSIDAEGFSTTLLALGKERASKLARQHPEITQVVFADDEGYISMLY